MVRQREEEKNLGKELEGRERGRNGAHHKLEMFGGGTFVDLGK